MATSTPPRPGDAPPGDRLALPGVSPPTPTGPRVRLPQLGLGLLLTVAAALGFLMWYAANLDRVPVLALGDDIERGHVLTLDDLTTVHVGSDDQIEMVTADAVDEVLGRVAVTAMDAGTLVVGGQFIDSAALVPGNGVVGLALAPGQYPTPHLRVGDVVNVVEVTTGQRLLVEAAEVVNVETIGTQGQRFVSVLTGEELAGEVAAAAASGEVRLVLVARYGQEVGR